MKIVAFNGSPRGKKGNTFIILSEINQGAERAGASMEIVNLSEYDIHMCTGCFKCWDKYEGKEIKCVFQDDTNKLLNKIKKADMVLFSSPLYYDNISSLLKMFIERFIQMHTAYVVQREKIWVHDIELKSPKIAFLCSCDLPGLYNFDIVSQYMKKVSWNLQSELVAEIYQSEARLIQWASEAMKIMVSSQKKVWEQTGYELATDGKLSGKTIELLRRPMIPYKYYIESANEIANETVLREKKRRG